MTDINKTLKLLEKYIDSEQEAANDNLKIQTFAYLETSTLQMSPSIKKLIYLSPIFGTLTPDELSVIMQIDLLGIISYDVRQSKEEDIGELMSIRELTFNILSEFIINRNLGVFEVTKLKEDIRLSKTGSDETTEFINLVKSTISIFLQKDKVLNMIETDLIQLEELALRGNDIKNFYQILGQAIALSKKLFIQNKSLLDYINLWTTCRAIDQSEDEFNLVVDEISIAGFPFLPSKEILKSKFDSLQKDNNFVINSDGVNLSNTALAEVSNWLETLFRKYKLDFALLDSAFEFLGSMNRVQIESLYNFLQLKAGIKESKTAINFYFSWSDFVLTQKDIESFTLFNNFKDILKASQVEDSTEFFNLINELIIEINEGNSLDANTKIILSSILANIALTLSSIEATGIDMFAQISNDKFSPIDSDLFSTKFIIFLSESMDEDFKDLISKSGNQIAKVLSSIKLRVLNRINTVYSFINTFLSADDVQKKAFSEVRNKRLMRIVFRAYELILEPYDRLGILADIYDKLYELNIGEEDQGIKTGIFNINKENLNTVFENIAIPVKEFIERYNQVLNKLLAAGVSPDIISIENYKGEDRENIIDYFILSQELLSLIQLVGFRIELKSNKNIFVVPDVKIFSDYLRGW